MRGVAPVSRRLFLRLIPFTALAAPVFEAVGPAYAQAARVSTTQLLAAPPLPDLWMGAEAAPVTMIEYASMDCSHCAAFHAETWPTLKSKYIDAGKVRFVLREFPLGPLATAAFMLARSIGPDKRGALIDLMFDQQNNWAFVPKPVEALENTVRQAGISHDAFGACLRDQKLYDQVNAERDQASMQFGVEATPTFFVNGVKHAGELSVAELEKLLDPLMKG